MKKLTLLLLGAVAAFAVDYSAMSTEELQAQRGKVAEADKAAFQSEMQSRMQSLSSQERQAMRESRGGSQGGSGSKKQTRGGQ
ncbi:MAG: DUF1104 domain-containing protein [Campylobacterales bacterium]|nr:DUF1104 domain-containing protein [Campylobacterales bacterium]